MAPGKSVKTHVLPPACSDYPEVPNLPPSELADLFDSVYPGPNYDNARVHMQSDLNMEGWESVRHIIDPIDATLVDQLNYGFTMGIDKDAYISIPFTNHKSSRTHYEVVNEFVIKHYRTGAINGPYAVNPLSVKVFPSPLQVAISASGKKRCVIDMSYPQGSSVNSTISTDWSQVPGFDGQFQLPTHDKICKLVLETFQPMMFVADLSAYFMQIPSDVADIPYMCFAWRGALFYHRRLPFGCRTACLHAQRVSDAVAAVHKAGAPGQLEPYIDDFDGIVTAALAERAHVCFHGLLHRLGLLATIEKCISPTFETVFLGLLYNLRDLTLALPADKITRVLAIIEEWLDREHCSKKQLQSLLGLMNHLTTVVHAGRPFTSALLDILKLDQFPHEVTVHLKQDLHTWRQFLQSRHAVKSLMKSAELVNPDTDLIIAAEKDKCAISVNGKVSGCRVQSGEKIPPHAMYAVAVWFASKHYCETFAGRMILVLVPTKIALTVINRANTPCTSLRPLIREMWMKQANMDCVIKAVYNKSTNNNYLFREFIDFVNIMI